MIIRVDMITTHMVIIVLKAIYRWINDYSSTDYSSTGEYSTSTDYSSTGEYSTSTDYSSTGEYSTSSIEYWGFGYFHHWADIAQPLRHIILMLDPLANHLSLQDLILQTYYYPYENYIPDFYTHRGDDDNDDFVPPRNSIWKWLY